MWPSLSTLAVVTPWAEGFLGRSTAYRMDVVLWKIAPRGHTVPWPGCRAPQGCRRNRSFCHLGHLPHRSGLHCLSGPGGVTERHRDRPCMTLFWKACQGQDHLVLALSPPAPPAVSPFFAGVCLACLLTESQQVLKSTLLHAGHSGK